MAFVKEEDMNEPEPWRIKHEEQGGWLWGYFWCKTADFLVVENSQSQTRVSVNFKSQREMFYLPQTQHNSYTFSNSC